MPAGTNFKVISLYKNEQATKDAIAKAFIALVKYVGEEDRLLILFVGHGATETYNQTDRGFIVPYGATDEVDTFIDLDDLKKIRSTWAGPSITSSSRIRVTEGL